MSDETTPTRTRGRVWPILALVALVVVGLAGWRGWATWRASESRAASAAADAQQRIAALEQRVEALRRDQRAQTQRMVDAAATNRLLRDEVLGLSQRGALLEDSVSKLADPTRHGAQALRLDEVELLLGQAQQRLAIADDLDGARRAYTLADGVLRGIDDPRLLNLRQALAQERLALDALGKGPQAALAMQLDGFAQALATLPDQASARQPAQQPVWQRLLSPLITVRRTQQGQALAPDDRSAGLAALQVEMALVRAALERQDTLAFHAGLDRLEAWLVRLWPDSPALRRQQQRLVAMRKAPLQPESRVLGSTLQQLRQLRESGGLRSAAPSPPGAPGVGDAVRP